MHSYFKLLAAFVVAGFTTVAAAADASPAGTWKWIQEARGDSPSAERTLKLEIKDGKLIGTVLGSQTGPYPFPDLAIANASHQNGAIAFSVEFELNGNKIVSKWTGKLEGDTIKGKIEWPGRDGQTMKTDWNPTRVK